MGIRTSIPVHAVFLGWVIALMWPGAAQGEDAAPAAFPSTAPPASYEESFQDLYQTLGRIYPCFELKEIDWRAVGQELLPRIGDVKTDESFGLLCLELVARLEDSHARVGRGTINPPVPPLPRWDPGFACLIDDEQQPVIYHVDRNGPAEAAGLRVGMTVLAVNGVPAEKAMTESARLYRRYIGFSSERYLRYQVARWFCRQMETATPVKISVCDLQGNTRPFTLPAEMDVRYLPRLPVPIQGIRDSANVSWTQLESGPGYIYVRRIRPDLISQLDRAVASMQNVRGLIVDVRGNSGGGFDSGRAHRNFSLTDTSEPQRPRYGGPMALLIDARCISAGEGWASWFVAHKRARLFGEATAGASSRKRQFRLKNGKFTVTVPVKAYHGYLDRPIERRGLEPDQKVRQNAAELAKGRDTVLEAAGNYLLSLDEAIQP